MSLTYLARVYHTEIIWSYQAWYLACLNTLRHQHLPPLPSVWQHGWLPRPTFFTLTADAVLPQSTHVTLEPGEMLLYEGELAIELKDVLLAAPLPCLLASGAEASE